MVFFFVLVGRIPLVTASAPTGKGTCYFIDGSIDSAASACYYLNTVGASMCCVSGEDCRADGVCTSAPNGLVGPDDSNESLWRRSCSDFTWQDPACIAIAPYVAAGAVQISRCSDGTYCPRNPSVVNTTCCEDKLGAAAGLSSAPIAPSLLRSIRKSGSSTSDTILTNSNSIQFTTAAVAALPTSLPTTITTPAAALPTSLPTTTTTPAAGGYTVDQKIALGVGIGIGLPTLLVAFLTLLMKCRH